VKFTLAGEPQSKQRARRGKGRHVFTPASTVAREALILAAFQNQVGKVEMDATHAFQLRLVFYRYERTKRDTDNLIKLVQDALNGHAYADDSQVEVGTWTTIWVDTRAEAKTVVHLTNTGTLARPPRRKAKAQPAST
jgi:Holliday junction resolvase RusA-like endonuclease